MLGPRDAAKPWKLQYSVDADTKSIKNGHKKNMKKLPRGGLFRFLTIFFITLPAHSVKKRAGAWHFLVRTSSVTHPSRLKTSFLKLYLGRV